MKKIEEEKGNAQGESRGSGAWEEMAEEIAGLRKLWSLKRIRQR